jgi:PBSX family phage terminase large subunit
LTERKTKSLNKLYSDFFYQPEANKNIHKISAQTIKKLIAPSFYDLDKDVRAAAHTHYWLDGGRGSTKTSFVSTEVIAGIMNDPMANGIIYRKVGETLKDSVYGQLLWAINALDVSELWDAKESPLQLKYKPTGQVIIFRGLDKAKKSKSIKLKKGYFKFIWFEEVDEFAGMEELRVVLQSLMRGGPQFCVFYSYNPPRSQRNWVNLEVQQVRPDRLRHHSTYLTVPTAWLGEQFIIEAEHLKKTKPDNYRHEYLGEVIGTGGEVFANVTIRRITDEEIIGIPRRRYGVDWGYATDPFVWLADGFDRKKMRLIIYDEIYRVGLSNRKAADTIKQHGGAGKEIHADSAEPKSIAECQGYGLLIHGAKKGPDSVDYGIKFLQDLEEIVIDIERCPNTAREFTEYELERDGNGNFKAGYPDKNNHCIDATRYSLEDDMKNRRVV